MNFSKTTLCPICFTNFALEDAKVRCVNVRCSGRTEDHLYAEYQGLLNPQVMGQVSEGQSKKRFGIFGGSGGAKCPTCSKETTKRVCPHCHFELLPDAGNTDERIVAVVGERQTGKSNYIAALINTLRNEFGHNFDAGVMARGETTRARYEEDYRRPLFVENTPVPMTASAFTNPRIKAPMVFRITFNQRRRQAVTIVLFDTAGEDMRNLDTMSTEARYIFNSDAIIYLLDPLQIDVVRQQLPEDRLPPRDHEAGPVNLVERLRELHEAHFNLSVTQKIEKPIAFTLSKMDELYGILDPGSVLLRSSGHQGYMNASDIESVGSEITAYLESWMGSEFERLVRTNYKDYRYFGVSAFGKPPQNNKIDVVSSVRVEDPLVWILSRFGVIKEK